MQKYTDVVLDIRGNAVSGASVQINTLAGTPATIYASNGSGVLANPLITDHVGRFSFYAANGRYTLNVKSGIAAAVQQADFILEDPNDPSPELIDGGTFRNGSLENVTIDGVTFPGTEVVKKTDLATTNNAAKGAGMVGFDGQTLDSLLLYAKSMAGYTALRAYTGRALSVRLTDTNVAAFYNRDLVDVTTPDDGYSVIVDGSGRRWKRTVETVEAEAIAARDAAEGFAVDASGSVAQVQTLTLQAQQAANDAANSGATATNVLRVELASKTDPLKGAGQVGNRGRFVSDRLADTLNIKDLGAKCDGVTDDAAAMTLAAAEALATGKKLVAYGSIRLGANVSLRNISFDLSAADIKIDDGFSMTIGGNAGSFWNPRQILGRVWRKQINWVPSTYTTPTVICIGAKGQHITIGFVEFLKFYMSTNPATYPADASQAYSTFEILYAMRIDVDTDPAYAGGVGVDGAGSANQWFNENAIRLQRCAMFNMRGSYAHNNNVITGGAFESPDSLINIEIGNKNVFENIRAEGQNLVVNFGPSTLGNTVECNWFASLPNVWRLPVVTDSGSLNIVRSAIDKRFRFVELLRITPNDPVFDTSVFPYAGREPSLVFIKSAGATYVTMGTSAPFEVVKGDFIYPTATAYTYAQQGVYALKLYFFNKNGSPVQAQSSFAEASSTFIIAGMALQLTFTTPPNATSGPAWIKLIDAAFTAGVTHVKAEVISSSLAAEGLATEILVTRMTKELGYSLPLNNFNPRRPVVSAVPTKGFCEAGTELQQLAGAQVYRCRFALDTYTTAAAVAGATTIIIDAVTRGGLGSVGVGHIVGINNDSGVTEWFSVSAVSLPTKTITLSSGLAGMVSAGARVVFNLFQAA